MFLFGYFLLFGLLRGLKFFEPIFKVFVVLRLMLRLLALHFGKERFNSFAFLCEGSVFPVLLFLKVFDDYQRMIVIELSMQETLLKLLCRVNFISSKITELFFHLLKFFIQLIFDSLYFCVIVFLLLYLNLFIGDFLHYRFLS